VNSTHASGPLSITSSRTTLGPRIPVGVQSLRARSERLTRALTHEDISITTHSGVAMAILRIIGYREYPLPSGGVYPIVVKVIDQR
jgi:hypothetical protein